MSAVRGNSVTMTFNSIATAAAKPAAITVIIVRRILIFSDILSSYPSSMWGQIAILQLSKA
jgi:hypothetical protein